MTLDHGGRWARRRVALRYRLSHGRWPDLDQPKRFTEWVQWRKLNDRSRELGLKTDKLASKALASATIGPDHVVPTIWSGETLPERPPAAFPLVVKSTHGCHQWRVVRDAEDWAAVLKLAPSWLDKTYGWLLDEWHYRVARPGLLIEPYLGGEAAALPVDYKVYVFAGRVQIVQAHVSRGKHHRWAQFDRDWNRLSEEAVDLPAPSRLAEMIVAAEVLAGDEDFLRVDFYEVDGQFLFGEFCLYPGSGFDPFRPDALDVMLGHCWSEARQRRLGTDTNLSAAA